MNVVSRLMELMGLGLAALLALAPLSVASGHVVSSGGTSERGAPSFGKDITLRMTDQLSAQTQATIFPRHDVAFNLTQRLWAHTRAGK